MLIAILQFELLIRGAQSLKDKRRVVKSVKDRLHREHLVAIAEVAHQDNLHVAGMAAALVGSDGKHLQSVMDTIEHKLKGLHDAELGSCYRETLSGEALPAAFHADDGSPLWLDSEKRETIP
jgi:uncharacterized protein YlxP (DUF503 family)